MILQLPEDLRLLRDALLSSGYVVVQEQSAPQAFGNYVGILAKGDTAVQFLRDRSQWFLEVGGQGADERFDAAIWQAYFDHGRLTSEAMPVSDQARFVRDHLPDIEAAATQDPNYISALRQLRHRRALARLGGA